MKVIVIGTVDFSYSALQHLVANHVNVVGVITRKTSPGNADHADLSTICKKSDIPFIYASDVNHERTLTFINNLTPDLIFCLGWSQLIKEKVLSAPKHGVIGFHPAELPSNRGRHPLIWALALGLESTASTFFLMDMGADTGDIISQERVAISSEDDAKDLYSKIVKVALGQLIDILNAFQNNSIKIIRQNHAEGNNWRKRGRSDGRIDFRMGSNQIYNLVRALTNPYIGAHIETVDGDIKVWKTAIGPDKPHNLEPGKILKIVENDVLVKSGDGSVWLLEHEFDQKPLINSYL